MLNTTNRGIKQAYTPAPSKLHGSVLKLMARNGCQVLGLNLDSPTKGILFFAPEYNGVPQGGTSQAIRIAKHYGIPTLNILETINLWDRDIIIQNFIQECISK